MNEWVGNWMLVPMAVGVVAVLAWARMRPSLRVRRAIQKAEERERSARRRPPRHLAPAA